MPYYPVAKRSPEISHNFLQYLGQNMFFIFYFCAVIARSMRTIQAIVHRYRPRIDKIYDPIRRHLPLFTMDLRNSTK